MFKKKFPWQKKEHESMRCVYAGPEYFERQLEKKEPKKCSNCGCILKDEDICPSCGQKVDNR